MSAITEHLPHTCEWSGVIWTDLTGGEHVQFVPRNKELINRPGFPVVNLEVDDENRYYGGHEGRATSLDLEVDIENPYGTEGRTAA